MKKNIYFLFIILFSVAENLNAQEQDSLLLVRIEKMSEPNEQRRNLNLVFENTSNDSILLMSHWKNFFEETPYATGIRMEFYYDNKLILPVWGEMPSTEFVFAKGRTIIPPHSLRKFPIDLPYAGDLDKSKPEVKVRFQIRFMYVNMRVKRLSIISTTTNYLILNNQEDTKITN